MGSDPNFTRRNLGSDPISRDPVFRVASEAQWPKASVVIGNPPFLGDKKMRSELGEDYTTTLRKVYEGRVPGGADLVCYWFEKARKAIETNGLGAAGLVSTNSIRGGKNRKVLEAICDTTRIYEAWSDEGWVNEGAAVRVSLVAFGHGTQVARLNGLDAVTIESDLGPGGITAANTTLAKQLVDNSKVSFQGPVLVGDFEVPAELARSWLTSPNPHGLSNSEVLRPFTNGKDITSRSRQIWVVDFNDLPMFEASLFEKPFERVRLHVKPERDNNRDESRRQRWWLHGRLGTDLRAATVNTHRYIATTRVSKFRTFVWFPKRAWISDAVVAIARADDTTFGILHSRFHELWSLRMCTWLGVGNDPRYTPTTCFETFPFPAGLTPANTAHQCTETLEGGAVIPAGFSESNEPLAPMECAQAATKNVAPITPDLQEGWVAAGSAPVKEEPAKRAGDTEQNPLPPSHPERAPTSPVVRDNAIAIAHAAKRLNDLRESWLNPKEWTDRVPEVIPLGMDKSPYPDRILPKRGHDKDLAERTLTKLYNQRPAWLDGAHKALDIAVAHAYGWADYTAAMPDDEILKRLLALNLERSAGTA